MVKGTGQEMSHLDISSGDEWENGEGDEIEQSWLG